MTNICNHWGSSGMNQRKCKCGHSRSWHGVPDENILGNLPCTHYNRDTKWIDCQCDNFQE